MPNAHHCHASRHHSHNQALILVGVYMVAGAQYTECYALLVAARQKQLLLRQLGGNIRLEKASKTWGCNGMSTLVVSLSGGTG